MPAPTVSFVASSTRTNAPVVRFSGYGSTASGSESRSVTSARSFSSSRSGAGTSRECLHVDLRAELVHDRARPPARVLHGEPGAGLERALAHPADPRDELAGGNGGRVRVGEHVAAGDVEVVLEPDHDGHRRHRLVERAVGGLDVRHARAPARGQDDDLVADAPRPARDLARVAAVVVVVGRHRPDHPLHREAAVGEVPVSGELDRLEIAEERRPVVPRRRVGALGDVVPVERRHREDAQVLDPDLLGERAQLGLDLAEALLRPVDEVHLVERDRDVVDAEQRHDRHVPARLLEHAAARVDEHDREVGRRGAGDHVARVLDVPGRVGELEAALRGHERAVGDVDRDPLLALGAKAVGEQREVDVSVAAAARGLLDVLELVGEDLLRVVEQPPDQRRLAVVDGAARDDAEHVRLEHLLRSSQGASGPPSRPR